MFKKISIVGFTVLLLSGFLASSALAASNPFAPSDRMVRKAGQITEVADGQFKLQTARQEILVLHNETTHFRGFDPSPAPEDLVVGNYVVVSGRETENGELIAGQVLLLPEGFEPGRFRATSAAGEVWAIDTLENTFTIRSRGEILRIEVDEDTIFNSRENATTDLSELYLHQRVLVVYAENDRGTLTAKRILAARPPLSRHAGLIDAVDLDLGVLILARRDGNTIMFELADSVEILGPDGEQGTLKDLVVGESVIVNAQPNASEWTAVQVRIRPPSVEG